MAGAANVNVREIDQSLRVSSFGGLFTGIVIPAYRGPADKPTLVSSENQFLKEFTPNNTVEVGYDLSYYSAIVALQNTNKLWVVRAINGALYSGAKVRSSTSQVDSSSFLVGMENPQNYIFDLFPDSVLTSQISEVVTVADVLTPAVKEVTQILTNPDTVIPAVSQVSTITCNADVAGSLAGDYFTYYYINATNNTQESTVFWFSFNGATAPVTGATNTVAITGVVNNDPASAVAARVQIAINSQVQFTTSSSGNIVTVINVVSGTVTPPIDTNTGFIFSVTTSGANAKSTLDGKYFILYSSSTTSVGYWYNITGTTTAPVTGATTNIAITGLNVGFSAATCAQVTSQTIDTNTSFSSTYISNDVTVTNNTAGSVPNSNAGTTGFTVSTKIEGKNAVDSLNQKSFELATTSGTVGLWIDYEKTQQQSNVLTTADVQGTSGVAEVSTITTVADVAGSLAGKYFILYPTATTSVAFWFSFDGATAPPAGTATTMVPILGTTDNDSANVIAAQVTAAITPLTTLFTATVVGNVVTVTNVYIGSVPDASAANSGFTMAVTTQGVDAVAPSLLGGKLFYIYSTTEKIGVWFSYGTTPEPSNDADRTIIVVIAPNDSANTVASKLQTALDNDVAFSATVSTNSVTATCVQPGKTNNAQDVSTGFTITTPVAGVSPPANLDNVTNLVAIRNIAQGATAEQVASAITSTMNTTSFFTATSQLNKITVTDITSGKATGTTAALTSGFTVSVVIKGANDDNSIDELFILYSKDQGDWGNKVGYTLLNYVDAPEVVKYPDSFQISIFYKGALSESFIVSRYENAIDGYGRSMYIEDVLTSSAYISAVNNLAIPATIKPQTQTTMLLLGGGSNGFAVTDAQMITALKQFENTDDITVNLIMDGGRTSPPYQMAIDSLCQKRGDCLGLFSIPYVDEASTNYLNAVTDYRTNDLPINSSYSAIYSTHVLIYDNFNGRDIYVSPESFAAQKINYTAQVFEPWYPPAGNTRGVINALNTLRRWTQGEMDVLQNIQINPIKFSSVDGIVIWGQETLYTKPSLLQGINVRLLLIVIEPVLKRLLQNFLFDLNDITTRSIIVSLINSYMNGVQARRGVTGYVVVADDSNNTPNDVANGILNVTLNIQPTPALKYINLTVVITNAGVTVALGQA